jgi:hypothetical protein
MPDQAIRYLLGRVRKTTIHNIDLRMHGAIVDLLLSEIPLGPLSRQFIAAQYLKLAFPNAKRERQIKARAQDWFATGLKQHLAGQGKTPGEVERAVAEALHISPATVRQRNSRKNRATPPSVIR